MTITEIGTRTLDPAQIIDARAVRAAIANREDAERKLELSRIPGRAEVMSRDIYERQRANAEAIIDEEHAYFNVRSHAHGYKQVDRHTFESMCL